MVGKEIAEQVRDLSLKIYSAKPRIRARAGIIIADTKFEFGIFQGKLILLIDEVLNPGLPRASGQRTNIPPGCGQSAEFR